LWFQVSNEEGKGVSEKTMKTGITRRISSRGNSVTDDLQVPFSVLNELAGIGEYYAMPTMPDEHGWDYQDSY